MVRPTKYAPRGIVQLYGGSGSSIVTGTSSTAPPGSAGDPAGTTWKAPVRVATTANGTFATAFENGDTIDGIVLATGDRILIKDQTDGTENGIYVVQASGEPVRSSDMNDSAEVVGSMIFVIVGTVNGGKTFRSTNTTPPVIGFGFDALTFVEWTIGSTSDLGWFNVEDYGAVHNAAGTSDAQIAAATDDTVAIQAAITAAIAAGGGTVWFPEGIYAVKGALQDTGTFNAQIEFSASVAWTSVRMLGAGRELSILRSDWNGTISGTPAIFSAGTHDSTAAARMVVLWERLQVMAHENPKLTAIDLTAGLICRWYDFEVNVARAVPFEFPVPWTLPTNANAVGIDMPYGLNSQPGDGGGSVKIQGYYTGLRPSEQFAADNVDVAFCTRGIEFRGDQDTPAFWRHISSVEHVSSYWNPRTLVFTADLRWVNIGTLDIEHDDAPFEAVYDIDDASNFGRGFIGWHTTDFTTGPEDNLLVNGATGLSLFGAHAKRWKLANVVDIPTGTNPSTNPSTGRRLYAASADGHLTVRKPDGTTVDLEAGGHALDDLTDVTITSVATGDMLRYSGSAWVNTPGRWEVVVSGTAPPVAVSTPGDDDWVYAWVNT